MQVGKFAINMLSLCLGAPKIKVQAYGENERQQCGHDQNLPKHSKSPLRFLNQTLRYAGTKIRAWFISFSGESHRSLQLHPLQSLGGTTDTSAQMVCEGITLW